jgi:plastocyanin domain-containing protein
MQLYAMSSGSFVRGATIMGVFALGTAPGLLSIGGLTSVVKGAFAQKFFKFAGVVVVLLALFSLNNSLNLIGWNPLYAFAESGTNVLGSATDPNVTRQGNVQVVRMTQTSSGYEPNVFTITQGIPVRWVITSQDPGSCAASLVSTKLGVRKILTAGENVIEFTPNEVGTILFSCSMGMYRGSFTVVASGAVQGATTGTTGQANNLAAAVPTNAPAPAAGNGGSCGGGGGGCGCGGGSKKPVVENTAPAAQVQGNVQVIKAIYTNATDIQPNTFTVKAGVPVRLEITPQDDGSGCMSSIMVSRLTSPEFLQKGKTITFNFTPSAGTYPITCAMGVPRGKIIVN